MSEMNIGDISRRLGVGVSSELLEQLGINVIQGRGRARYVAEDDWDAVCEAVSDWCLSRKGAAPVAKPPPKEKVVEPVITKPSPLPATDNLDWEDDDEL